MAEICDKLPMPKITHGPANEDLRRLFSYDPETGAFTRLCRSGKAFPGPFAGNLRSDGYLQAKVGSRTYLLHRLAVQYMTGEWPSKGVDHINGWANLRVVEHVVNVQNRRNIRKSKKGQLPLGVVKSNSRWAAYLTHQRRGFYLGTYDSPEEAHDAYLRKKREIHPGCTI
jgi:hypothetical protein